jgi:hypothetical protein
LARECGAKKVHGDDFTKHEQRARDDATREEIQKKFVSECESD